MDRRSFLHLLGSTTVLGLGLTRLGSRSVRAGEATDLAGLGLPELRITLTETEYRVSPATTPAGWALVTFENRQRAGDNSADIVLIPPGESVERLLDVVATPTAAPPAWAYQTTLAGAPWAPAGTSAQAVVLLTAGDWAVLSPAPLTPASLTVTAGDGAPTEPPGLTADVDVTMQEFAFVGLEEPVPAGRQIWKVTNAGQQPHLMTLGPLPDGTTQARFMDDLGAAMTDPSAADAPDPGSMLAGLPTASGSSTLSVGQSLYLALDLAPGTYGAVCFFPDRQTGAPHLLMGMAQIFTVGE